MSVAEVSNQSNRREGKEETQALIPMRRRRKDWKDMRKKGKGTQSIIYLHHLYLHTPDFVRLSEQHHWDIIESIHDYIEIQRHRLRDNARVPLRKRTEYGGNAAGIPVYLEEKYCLCQGANRNLKAKPGTAEQLSPARRVAIYLS
jgi:hypothetical protein